MAKNGKHVGGAPVGNANRLTHGLRRSEAAIGDGTPLRGLAHELEIQATTDREINGTLWAQKQIADRVKGVADLAYGLLCSATEPDRIAYFLVKFGWLAGRAFNMLEKIRHAEAEQLSNDDKMWDQVSGNE